MKIIIYFMILNISQYKALKLNLISARHRLMLIHHISRGIYLLFDRIYDGENNVHRDMQNFGNVYFTLICLLG